MRFQWWFPTVLLEANFLKCISCKFSFLVLFIFYAFAGGSEKNYIDTNKNSPQIIWPIRVKFS